MHAAYAVGHYSVICLKCACAADLENKAVTKSLNLLLNLSSNDDLASRVASVPGCVAFLVGLLSHTLRPLVVMAARCLINLTHSSTEGQAEAERVRHRHPPCSYATWASATVNYCGRAYNVQAALFYNLSPLLHCKCRLGCCSLPFPSSSAQSLTLQDASWAAGWWQTL